MAPVANDRDIDQWLIRLRSGDDLAVQAIYRGFFGGLTAFVRLHVDDSAAVEEIVDDAFMVVFTKPEQFEGRSSFKTWLFGIAKNLCHDWLRKAGRQPAIAPDNDQLLLEGLVDPAWPVLDHLEQAQIHAIIRLCIQRLPDVQREVLYWVFFEEKSVDQTADEVRCASGTVKSRLFHAKAKLADCVSRRLNNGVA